MGEGMEFCGCVPAPLSPKRPRPPARTPPHQGRDAAKSGRTGGWDWPPRSATHKRQRQRGRPEERAGQFGCAASTSQHRPAQCRAGAAKRGVNTKRTPQKNWSSCHAMREGREGGGRGSTTRGDTRTLHRSATGIPATGAGATALRARQRGAGAWKTPMSHGLPAAPIWPRARPAAAPCRHQPRQPR